MNRGSGLPLSLHRARQQAQHERPYSRLERWTDFLDSYVCVFRNFIYLVEVYPLRDRLHQRCAQTRRLADLLSGFASSCVATRLYINSEFDSLSTTQRIKNCPAGSIHYSGVFHCTKISRPHRTSRSFGGRSVNILGAY